MKYLLLLLLFSCKSYRIHEANLVQQQKTMLQFDQKSRNEQQKIRDSRKKRVKVKKSHKKRKIV
jgi:aconitase A